MMVPINLSIIFVNWNSTDYLIDCLASIYAHTRDIDFEIIVVDNASPAADSQRVKEKFDKIKLVTSSHNLGFAGGNNLAFKHSSGAHLLFLNPDTKLFNAAINLMLRYLGSLPD